MGFFEVPNVGTDVVEVGLLVIAWNKVVGSISLIGGDEIGIWSISFGRSLQNRTVSSQ